MMKNHIFIILMISTNLFGVKYTEELDGIYASDIFGKVNIIKKDKGYYIANSNKNSFTLIKEKNNMYSIKYRILGFIPVAIDKLSKIKLYLEGKYIKINNNGKVTTVAVKVNPQQISRTWKKYQGTYICTDSNNNIIKVVAKIIDNLFVLNLYFKSNTLLSLILKIKDSTHGIIISPNKENQKILYMKDNMFKVDKYFYKKL